MIVQFVMRLYYGVFVMIPQTSYFIQKLQRSSPRKMVCLNGIFSSAVLNDETSTRFVLSSKITEVEASAFSIFQYPRILMFQLRQLDDQRGVISQYA